MASATAETPRSLVVACLSGTEGLHQAAYAADFSGDGVADLIAVTADGHVRYCPNNSGSNTNHVPFAGTGLADGEGWNQPLHVTTQPTEGRPADPTAGVPPAGV